MFAAIGGGMEPLPHFGTAEAHQRPFWYPGEGYGASRTEAGRPAGSSRVALAYLTSTLTLRVLASSRLGMLMVSTPSLKVASTLSASTTAGSLTVRVKEP